MNPVERHPHGGGVNRIFRDLWLLGWAIASVLLTPFLLLRKRKKYRKRYDPAEIDPRRWHVPALTPELTKVIHASGKVHVVFVGDGFGEFVMVDRVVNELRKRSDAFEITYAVRDLPTIDSFRTERPNLALAVWPFDFLVPVVRWLRQQRPDMVVFTERFRYVTLANAASRYGAKVAVINGFSKERRSATYRILGPLYRWQFSAYDALLMQTQEFADNVSTTARPGCVVRNTGDLKADLNGASLPADRVETFRKWLCEGHQDPILFAGSTGSLEEEELVLRAFAKVREKHPVRLLIGIRRLSRAAEVAQLIRSHGFTVTRRTEDGPPADVFLLDTLGKLSYAYRFGVAAYVGGSLGRGKGHNILEPLETGIPVAYGSNRGLFKESQIKAEEAGVGTRIETSDDLAAFFLRYLESPEEREKARVAGTELIRRNQGAVAASADELLKLIESCR